VLSVRPQVINAVAEKLRKAEDDGMLEQFRLLLLDQRSIQALADETLNDESVVTADNAARLLEAMRQATAAEVKKEADEALAAQRRKSAAAAKAATARYELEKAAQQAELAKLDEERLSRTRELEAARLQLDELRQRSVKVAEGIVARVNRATSGIGRAIAAATIFMSGLALLDLVTGLLASIGAWAWALRAIGAYGGYVLLANFLHWKPYGLADLLDLIAKALLRRQLRPVHLTPSDLRGLTIEGGAVTWSRDIASLRAADQSRLEGPGDH
jgi:hypothetical protein